MSYNYQEDDIPLSFGYRQNGSHSTNPAYTHPDPVNTNHSMIDMKTVRQYKAEQARILEQFNTPCYSLLVDLYWIDNYIVGIWSREYVVF